MPSAETGKFRRKAGRREKPLPDDGDPRTILAARLRELKSACGSPTYDELARLSRVYKTGLLEAASATRLPRWHVIKGYAEGCWKYYENEFGEPFADAGNLSQWQQLYREAMRYCDAEKWAQPVQRARRRGDPAPPISPSVSRPVILCAPHGLLA
jgi:hypothetical protein